jgi:hypothetical protein
VEIGGKRQCWSRFVNGQKLLPSGQRRTINNYNFNKQRFKIKCLRASLGLVVVMKIVELWKASQPTDIREFMMQV